MISLNADSENTPILPLIFTG